MKGHHGQGQESHPLDEKIITVLGAGSELTLLDVVKQINLSPHNVNDVSRVHARLAEMCRSEAVTKTSASSSIRYRLNE